jgi:hypothetical protein
MLWFLLACASPEPTAPTAAPASAPPPPAAPAATASPSPKRELAPRLESIVLTPEAPTRTDTIRVKVEASHPKDEAVDLDYQWLINDVAASGAITEALRPGRFRKGDTVTVRVSARVGTREVERISNPVVVANTPPDFKTRPRDVRELDGFRFKADDLDGDPIGWSLQDGPPGMSIGQDGVMTYKGARDAKAGDYRPVVVASDGADEVRYSFDVRVSAGSDAAKK